MSSTSNVLALLWLSISSGAAFQADFSLRSALSKDGPAASSTPWLESRVSAAAIVGEAVVKELRVLAEEHAVNRQLVIVVASADWEEMLMNWVVRAHHVHLKNYVIFATDDSLAKRLGSLGAPVLKLKVTEGSSAAGIAEAAEAWKSDLWMKRWVLVSELLKDGFDVLHADLDAIMVNSPRALLNRRDADIIISRGMPKENWWLCMGFVFMRSTPSVINFLPRFLGRLNRLGDDQRAFNQVLAKDLGVRWNANPFDPRSVSWEVSGNVPKLNMKVSVLPNWVARRLNCAPRSMTGKEIVAHCRTVSGIELTQSTGAGGKAQGLRTVGLWSLRKDWRGLDCNGRSWESCIEHMAQQRIPLRQLRLQAKPPNRARLRRRLRQRGGRRA